MTMILLKHFPSIIVLTTAIVVTQPIRAQEADESQSTAESEGENDTTVEDGSNSQDKADAESEQEASRRPPGSFDIDEEAATRALERSLVQINALLLPPGKVEVSLNTSFGSDASNTPVIVPVTDPNDSSQTVNALGITQFERRNYAASLNASFGLPYDSQFGFNIPFKASNIFSSTSVENSNAGRANFSIAGIGDLSLSLLKTVLKEKGRRPDIIARFTIDLDTGDDNSDGLSTGSDSVEYTLALNATKRQDPMVFTYQVSHTIAAENNGFKAGDATELSLGTILAASPYTSVKFSFSQTILGKSELNGEPIEQTNRAPANISFGTSSVVGRSVFIFTDVSTGLNDVASDYTIRIGISRQFSIF